MAFPTTPDNGDYYTNALGTMFQFISADDKWVIVKGGVSSMPAGTILGYGAGTMPSGFLICDGSAVSRTTYGDLFAVIGTTYGVGDGSTTFNVPNLKGKVPVGLDSGDANFDVLNTPTTYVGAKTHTLITAEIPSHNHSLAYGSNINGPNTLANYSNPATGTTYVGNTGGDGAHNNLQPYLVINYMIKHTTGVSITGNISDAVYGAGWNGVTDVAPSKNAVYDKIETLGKEIIWRDAAQWDYSSPGTLTIGGGYHTKDISAIVPAGYSNVILIVYQTGQMNANFRKTGYTNYSHNPYSSVAGGMEYMILMGLDSSRQFDYQFNGGTAYIQIVGWM